VSEQVGERVVALLADERAALREKLIEYGVSSSLAVRDVLDDLTAWLDAREREGGRRLNA
jgi:hypothetical protein